MSKEHENTQQTERWEQLLSQLIEGVSSRAEREELLKLSSGFGESLQQLQKEFPSLFQQLLWQAAESRIHLHLPLQHKRRAWYETDGFHSGELPAEPLGVIKDYPLLRLLREGSFGSRTYLSKHTEGYLCLLKVYEPGSIGLTADLMFHHQERMIQRLHRITTPEVEEVLEHFLCEDGTYVQVKPFLSCVSLWDWMLTFPVLEVRLRLARRIGETLQNLHHQGIAHIDFKPDQILILVDPTNGVLEEEPEFVLIDYDFSMIDGEILVAVGSAPYYAPEQFARKAPSGHDAGVSIDTYAFGIFLHRMFAGRYPFGDGRTKPTHLLKLKQQRKWNSLWIPFKPLRKLLKKALHPNPANRPELYAILSCLASPKMLELVSEHKGLWNDEVSYLGQYWVPLSIMVTVTLSILFLMVALNLNLWIPVFLLFYLPGVLVWLRWLSRSG